jgi:hypothetical protein
MAANNGSGVISVTDRSCSPKTSTRSSLRSLAHPRRAAEAMLCEARTQDVTPANSSYGCGLRISEDPSLASGARVVEPDQSRTGQRK